MYVAVIPINNVTTIRTHHCYTSYRILGTLKNILELFKVQQQNELKQNYQPFRKINSN